jgi:CBS domain containing-hemolysin-like protein
MKLFDWIQDLTSQTPSEANTEDHPVAPILKARLAELEKLSVREVMIPRSVIMALDADVQLRRVRRLKSSKTVYFPVYKGDLDHILGWISKQKVMELLNEPTEDFQLVNFLRPLGEVSDTASVAELADIFLKSASPFLVVKNSQGSTVGIVPLAEFIELVFGFEIDSPATTPSTEISGPPLRSHEI